MCSRVPFARGYPGCRGAGGVRDNFGRRPVDAPKRHDGGFGKIGSTGFADHLALDVISELAGDEYLCVDTNTLVRF